MWWKIDDIPQQELDAWASAVARYERAAKRDPEVMLAGAFVIYEMDGSLHYAPGHLAPDGAYVVERWTKRRRGWTNYE